MVFMVLLVAVLLSWRTGELNLVWSLGRLGPCFITSQQDSRAQLLFKPVCSSLAVSSVSWALVSHIAKPKATGTMGVCR